MEDSGPGHRPRGRGRRLPLRLQHQGGRDLSARGLGLALVRQAVQRLGGTMTITSPAGALHVPRHDLPRRHARAGQLRPHESHRRSTMSDIRVLVVEDEPIAAAAHAAYVGRLDGFTLAGTAPDGQSALRLLTEFAAAGTPGGAGPAGHEPSGPARAGHRPADAGGRTVRRHHRHHRRPGTEHRPQRRGHRRGPVPDQAVHLRHVCGQAGQLPAVPGAAGRPRPGAAGPGASQSDVDQAFASLRAPSELPLPKGLACPRWTPSRTS